MELEKIVGEPVLKATKQKSISLTLHYSKSEKKNNIYIYICIYQQRTAGRRCIKNHQTLRKGRAGKENALQQNENGMALELHDCVTAWMF